MTKFPRKKAKLYVSRKDMKKEEVAVKGGITEAREIELETLPQSERETPLKDERLDRIMPLVTDMLIKLLATAGMARYRKDFTSKIKGIMNGKEV